MRRHLGDAFRLYVARRSETIVAGMVCVTLPRRWAYLYGAASRPDRSHASEALMWHVFNAATASGAQAIDLGASLPDSGADTFKRKWGRTSKPVEYAFVPLTAGGVPRSLDAYRSGRSIPQRAWSILPHPLAARLGPRLRRQLPFG
jgi:CelD/BcsL family acetyltransferase involved in cellulose biosynthesis